VSALVLAGLFLSCDNPGNGGLDTSALEAKIAQAEALLETTAVSTNGEEIAIGKYWVTQDEWDDFESIVEAAKIVLNSASSQEAVNEAVNDLIYEIDEFFDNRTRGSRTTGLDADDLAELIADAEIIKGQVKISTDGKNIDPFESWVTQTVMDELTAAINTAKSVTSGFDTAYTTLNEAIGTFESALKPGLKALATITITGLPNGATEVYIDLSLTDDIDKSELGGEGSVENNRATIELYDFRTEILWIPTGSWYVAVGIIYDENDFKQYVSKNPVNFGANAHPTLNLLTDFEELGLGDGDTGSTVTINGLDLAFALEEDDAFEYMEIHLLSDINELYALVFEGSPKDIWGQYHSESEMFYLFDEYISEPWIGEGSWYVCVFVHYSDESYPAIIVSRNKVNFSTNPNPVLSISLHDSDFSMVGFLKLWFSLDLSEGMTLNQVFLHDEGIDYDTLFQDYDPWYKDPALTDAFIGSDMVFPFTLVFSWYEENDDEDE